MTLFNPKWISEYATANSNFYDFFYQSEHVLRLFCLYLLLSFFVKTFMIALKLENKIFIKIKDSIFFGRKRFKGSYYLQDLKKICVKNIELKNCSKKLISAILQLYPRLPRLRVKPSRRRIFALYHST